MATRAQPRYVGAIDQGTTTTRFMIFDHDAHEVAGHQLAHEQIKPQDGWVEHDPHEIWEATQDVIEGGLGRAGIEAADLAAIGVTNQRETMLVWDGRTGEPYYNAIARQDARHGKIRWILDNVDGVRADVDAGHAIFGTIDTWLMWWLTGGPDGGVHLTDVTNASRTTLMDIHGLEWDDERLAGLGIPRSALPEIRSSAELYGRTVADGPFAGEVAIAGDLADRHAALLGQVCLRPGELAYGGGDVLLNTGDAISVPGGGLTTTVAYRLGSAPAVYALEGPLDAVIAERIDLRVARVDGGATTDESAMQELSDLLGIPVSKPVVAETAALGAAYAAGLAVGFWADAEELMAGWHESRRWDPTSPR